MDEELRSSCGSGGVGIGRSHTDSGISFRQKLAAGRLSGASKDDSDRPIAGRPRAGVPGRTDRPAGFADGRNTAPVRVEVTARERPGDAPAADPQVSETAVSQPQDGGTLGEAPQGQEPTPQSESSDLTETAEIEPQESDDAKSDSGKRPGGNGRGNGGRGSSSNNGGGNGAEGASPGRGHGANDDEG